MFGPGIAGGVPLTGALPTVQDFPPPRAPFSYPTHISTWYVDSAGGNQYPYNSWEWAATSLATIAALDVAGDTIYVASTHAESASSSISWSWAGTNTSPTRIICADKTSGAPPSTIATGASVTCTSTANTITVASGTAAVYIYGLTFVSACTAAATACLVNSGNGPLVFDSCSFQLSGVSGTSTIQLSTGCTWFNCSVKFGASGQTIVGALGWTWQGGSLLAGGTSPTTLIGSTANGFIENVDLSNASSTINLLSQGAAARQCVFRNIKFPSSWTGLLNSSTPLAGQSCLLFDCDSAGTNYILHRQTQFGDVYSETTIVRSGGASDGTTPLSWKMTSLAASGTFPITALQSGEFSIWNDTTGSRTITVEFLHDSLTNLQNDDIWLEVDYYGASGNPQGTLASSAMTNVLSTPADCTSSSATWTTTGMTNPNKQSLSVIVNAQLKGTFIATVKLCKPSYTVYVDPSLTVN